MKRACKLSLKFLTEKKQGQISALLQSYRAAVNFYIQSLWKTKGAQDAETLSRLKNSRLSQRYKQAALKQAMDVNIATKRAAKERGKPCKTPVFSGYAVLDSRFAVVERGQQSFDLVVKLSVLAGGTRIVIPTKKTKVLNKWMSIAGAKVVQGCGLSENDLILWVELPDLPDKTTGKVIAVDVGVNKLLVDSSGKQYGTDFKRVRDKVRRCKKGSKGCQRARTTRDHFINRTVKQLPWGSIKAIGIEDLKGIKTGKKKGRGKNFRKAMAPWACRQVTTRIEQVAQENRVRLVVYNPRNTSRECPECGLVSKDNRKGEIFLCIGCNHKADADHVGAQNGLVRTLATLRSVQSLRLNQVIP